jgi:hypothetical protein
MTGDGDGLADRRIERKKLAGSCLKIANADEEESSKQTQMRERELYLVERLKETSAMHKTRGLVFLFFPYTQGEDMAKICLKNSLIIRIVK